MISKDEYMKIFDYILDNYKDLMDEEYITTDFLLQIRLFVKGKRSSDDFMTVKHIEIIIKNFLEHDSVFDKETPQIILDDENCINRAINNDIYSVNYLNCNDKNLDIINLVLDKDYILSIDSPLWLKKNYEVALKSIKLNCFSVDDIYFEFFNDNERKLLILELLKTNYILNSRSSEYLRNNREVVLHSIKRDIYSYKYSFIYFYKDYDIFKYLLDNNYEFNEEDLKQLKLIPLSFIKSSDILYKVFEVLDIYIEDDNSYKKLFSNLYFSLLSDYPTIKSFDKIIEYLSNKDWEEYRKNNINILSNIYGKIIAIIKNNDSYEKFEEEFMYLNNKISGVLTDKYDLLLEAIKEYYQIYHSGEIDKSKLESSSLLISKYSSLYICMQKEQYKANLKDNFYEMLMNCFIPKLDNKLIKNKIIHYIKKSIFDDRYKNNDINIKCFINNLEDKYVHLYGDWINKAITKFFDNNFIDLRYIIKRPNGYKDYLRYIEAIRLLNRLNKGYIKYNDQELTNYRDIVIYDNVDFKYKYNGKINFDIDKCLDYYNKEIIFKKFIKEVMLFINKIEVDKDIFNKYLENISLQDMVKGLPFTDEYYEFDSRILNNFKLEFFISKCISRSKPICDMDNYDYNAMYNILNSNNLVWLWLLNDCLDIQQLIFRYNIKISSLIDAFNNIDKIKSLSEYLDIDYIEYGNLFLLHDIGNYSDNRIINLISPNTIKTVCSETDYTGGHGKKDIIRVSADLICQMTKRLESTVPYIDGNFNGYHYSMYDNLEDDVLLAGPNVDSCLKVCGNDNDFLHYCMIDKNGFIIKITNRNGNFIGRAVGFRNGNFIYINQLRTIYDKGGTGYCGSFNSEKEDLVEVLIKAGSDIINISQNNTNETNKIDYIFITQSYAFSNYSVDSELSNKLHEMIGKYPVDISTDDWNNFYKNIHNIFDTGQDECFNTDYSDYNLICIASSKNIYNLKKNNDLKIGDVEAVYKRPRNKLIVTNIISNDIVRKINKIRAIYSYYHDDFNYYDTYIPTDSIVVVGDNWYLIYKGNLIDYCIQDFDDVAKREFEVVNESLLEYVKDNLVIEKIKKLYI